MNQICVSKSRDSRAACDATPKKRRISMRSGSSGAFPAAGMARRSRGGGQRVEQTCFRTAGASAAAAFWPRRRPRRTGAGSWPYFLAKPAPAASSAEKRNSPHRGDHRVKPVFALLPKKRPHPDAPTPRQFTARWGKLLQARAPFPHHSYVRSTA